MKTVFCVRHGESTDNGMGVHQTPHSVLTTTGEAQAEAVAERAVDLHIEALISSTYPRAVASAEKISATTGKPVELSDLLIERKKPGSIEGKPYDDQDPVTQATHREWQDGFYVPGSACIEDGENFEVQLARADQALAYLAFRPEDRILVVTHGLFLRTMVARILLGDQLSPETHAHFNAHLSMGNTALTELQFFETDNRWSLQTYGDLSHLAG